MVYAHKRAAASPAFSGQRYKKIINIRLPTPKIMLKGAIFLDPDVTRGPSIYLGAMGSGTIAPFCITKTKITGSDLLITFQ